jgi:hypothetical protein
MKWMILKGSAIGLTSLDFTGVEPSPLDRPQRSKSVRTYRAFGDLRYSIIPNVGIAFEVVFGQVRQKIQQPIRGMHTPLTE